MLLEFVDFKKLKKKTRNLDSENGHADFSKLVQYYVIWYSIFRNFFFEI